MIAQQHTSNQNGPEAEEPHSLTPSTKSTNQERTLQGSPLPPLSEPSHTHSAPAMVEPKNGKEMIERICSPPNKRSVSPGTNKVMSVFTSSQHNTKPSQVEIADEVIPIFSLSRKSTSTSNTSIEGEVASPITKTGGYEGTDL